MDDRLAVGGAIRLITKKPSSHDFANPKRVHFEFMLIAS